MDLPTGPAVYCWWRHAEPFYVDSTENLAWQLFEQDLRAGLSPVPRFRRVARRRGQAEGVIPRGADTRERQASIDAFIEGCEVSWIPTSTIEEAEDRAMAASELLEETRSPDETELLDAYLDSLEHQGRVYREVPIGRTTGRRPRRIDAVRFPNLPDENVAGFDPSAFHDDLAAQAIPLAVELIEVKHNLNRPVFGQLLMARELAVDEWGIEPHSCLASVALVGATDPALEPIFTRHGLRIVVQDPS